jgi:dolichol-phosphate mannosyltransferase
MLKREQTGQFNKPAQEVPLRPITLGVILPTYNERGNVEPMLALLERALSGISYEVIFVDDDSPDGTAALVREISQWDPRVRVVQRVSRRGLSSACLEGMMATAAPYVAVMDADMQHDEKILPQMLDKCMREELDLVVATRNADGGGMGEFAEDRVRLSQWGRNLSQWVTRTSISDPMSGFFLADRRWIEEVIHLTSRVGFKILLDLVASSPRAVRFAEVPYVFRNRKIGESKLDILVGLEYLELLLDKSIGSLLPTRFVIYSMVGGAGLLLAMLLFYCLRTLGGYSFQQTQVAVTAVVMMVNFFANNTLTFRAHRLRGRQMWAGLATFIAACTVGVVINLRIAEFAQTLGSPWYLSAALGLVVSGGWNYGVTSMFTWRQLRRSLSARTARTQVARAPKPLG